ASVTVEGETLIIRPAEETVTSVSVLLLEELEILVDFFHGVCREKGIPGKPQWIGKKLQER
ncbi:hypothetical protein EVA_13492, partial [gut metagenome]